MIHFQRKIKEQALHLIRIESKPQRGVYIKALPPEYSEIAYRSEFASAFPALVSFDMEWRDHRSELRCPILSFSLIDDYDQARRRRDEAVPRSMVGGGTGYGGMADGDRAERK